MESKTNQFKAEISEMLDLVVNSLYSKKEIFLRELISNASDAIDRAKFLSLTDKSLVQDNPDWKMGYGYQFWMTYQNSFFFNGMGCQHTLCFGTDPSADLSALWVGRK